jgi:hypothetical protein
MSPEKPTAVGLRVELKGLTCGAASDKRAAGTAKEARGKSRITRQSRLA